MLKENRILVGKDGEEPVYVNLSMANRHGLIAGATGTGKTITLKVLAESFSDAGVPVFLADVKGDLSGMPFPGEHNENVDGRIESMGLEADGFTFSSYPVNFWDVYGKAGMPLRTTISEMGPILLSRILDLNDLQTDLMSIIFKIADDEGLLLIDTKDLKAMISYVSERRQEYASTYGQMAPQSLAAMLRAVVALEADGGEIFFGEPALDIDDWLQTDASGKGMIQILSAQELYLHPALYSMFLLWLMSELFEALPEVGDAEKPKMVFFFDEAHLLFNEAPKVLLQKIEQVVRLIRSKGVGIYFVTQAPSDIPDTILAQLGNKIQHALRAYTPAEQKKLKAAAKSFRENPDFDTAATLQELGTGKALVSVLDEEGIPTVVRKTKILPPQSLMGTIENTVRENIIVRSSLCAKYSETIDRDSAYEFMQRRKLTMAESQETETEDTVVSEDFDTTGMSKWDIAAQKVKIKTGTEISEHQKSSRKKSSGSSESFVEKEARKIARSTANSAAGTIGREVGKNIGSAGGTFGKRLGGNIGASLGRGLIGTLFDLGKRK